MVITSSKVFETGSWECAQGKQYYYYIYNTLIIIIIIILTGRDATNQTVIHRVNCYPRAVCMRRIYCVYLYRGCGIYLCNNIIYVPCRCVTRPFFLFFFTLPVYRVLFSRHIDVRTHESHLIYAHTRFTRCLHVCMSYVPFVSVFSRTTSPRRPNCNVLLS